MKKTLLLLFLLCAAAAMADGQSLPTLIPYLDGHKWGYADSNGHVIVKPKWQGVNFFKNGRADVYAEDEHCVIDAHGAYIIPPYRHWNGKFYSSVIGAYYNAMGRNGKYGIIDSNNHEILPCLYDRTNAGNGFTASGYFKWDKNRNTYIAKAAKNGKLGIIDTLNHTLIPFEYDGIDFDGFPFSSPKYYVIKKGEQIGVIDTHNRQIIAPEYRNIWLDNLDDNQIMLFKEKTTVIADTNGNISLEIPGYSVEFPRQGLIPVRDSTGKYGLMNYERQLIMPCEYLSTGVKNDSIIVSQLFVDSNKKQAQYFKCYDVNTLRELSGWLSYQQYTHIMPTPVAQPAQQALNNKLPHYTTMHIMGKDVYEYRIGDILWAAIGRPEMPEYYMQLRGIATGDSTVNYAAIIDTNGNYIVGPQLSNNELQVINGTDSLLLIKNNDKGGQYAVTDYRFNTILPFQQYDIAAAFYYENRFYAIARHDWSYVKSWHSFEGGGSYMAHDYTYYLLTAEGAAAPMMDHYKLHWYTDSNGYRQKRYAYGNNNEDGFDTDFKGYFMATDSLGKKGIVNIHGQTLLPSLSFKYYQLCAAGPNVFLVSNNVPKQASDDYSTLTMPNTNMVIKDSRKLQHGMPYLVNSSNKVLLDSLTTGAATNIAEPGARPLYDIQLNRSSEPNSERDIRFYMNDEGKTYYGSLPGEKQKKAPGKK